MRKKCIKFFFRTKNLPQFFFLKIASIRPSLNSLIKLLKRESLLGEKLGAGEGLLPTARIVWMPPGALMPVVDQLPWPPKLLGLPQPTHLPNTSSPTLPTFGSKAAQQVFGWKLSLKVVLSLTSPSIFPMPLKWSLHPSTQFLLNSAPYAPFSWRPLFPRTCFRSKDETSSPEEGFLQAAQKL